MKVQFHRHTKMKTVQNMFLLALLFCPVLFYAGTTFFDSERPDSEENTTFLLNSNSVKASIRAIKERLEFRPPLGILPFVRMMGHYIATPNYNLANCVIGKSMCTQMNGILCYLWDTEGFVANNRSIMTENWKNTYCKWKNDFKTWKLLQDSFPQPLETTFIARDPLHRFISAFLDKCVHEKVECYGCFTNVTCVVEKAYEEVVQYSKDHPNINVRRDVPVDISYEGRHFAPLTWNCDLWDRFEEYTFIKYGEDSASFNNTRLAVLNFFKNQKVEEEKLDSIDYALNFRSYHATKTKYAQIRKETLEILLNSRKHLELMAQMYYYDYLAFGFTSPVEIYYPPDWKRFP